MRVLFDYHELLGVVEIGVAELAENANDAQKHAHRESKKKDKKALYFIHQGVNDEVFEKIEDATTSKQAWDILMTTFKGVEQVTKHIAAAIEEAHDLSQMTVEELSGSLEAHEQRMNEKRTEKSIEQAFQSQVSIKGDQGGETSQKHGDDDQEKSNFGHRQNTRGRGCGCGRGRYKENDQKAHYVQEEDDSEDHALLMVTSTNEASNYHTWFLDTGYESTVLMMGKGRILIKLKNGDHNYILDMFYVSDMKSNLLSLGQLLEKENMVKGLPSINHPEQLCEACTLGKHSRLAFVVGKNWRARKPLELVHSDVCDPMSVTSTSNNRSPTRSLQNITLVEAWSGFKPSVKHLKKMKLGDLEPIFFEEAVQDPKWVNAMLEEMKAIEKNNTWELANLPQGQKAIDVKWVFKTKMKSNGEIKRHRARLVARGFEQRPGHDYKESTFFNGPLEEEVFVKQPPGFMKEGSEDKVYRLKKALYDLKQAPQAWNKRIDSFFVKVGFKKCNNTKMIEDFKRFMMHEFKMIDLGVMSYFLARTLVEVGTKLFKEGEEARVNPTFFKQLVGSLSDWGGDLDDHKSTIGYCFNFGSTACSWSSKKQSIATFSTCEAEYVAAASSACQAIWLQSLKNQVLEGYDGDIYSIELGLRWGCWS
ncbi:hypothetical protein SLEP1_g34108 [Rubroshorea leprosula]|uniref:Reverse transcriptase Ty1/copia-type domain-containing protein n=1 Tax=Rubroshorea leprosula TaxID=152421 RepID=A0AAV5KIR1_9ROSI|nr:hypothetical protein SLEP1_g34108 [Rubroshorea leprosula]